MTTNHKKITTALHINKLEYDLRELGLLSVEAMAIRDIELLSTLLKYDATEHELVNTCNILDKRTNNPEYSAGLVQQAMTALSVLTQGQPI